MSPLAPAIEAAYAASRILVIEADIDALDNGKVQVEILKKGMNLSGQSLKGCVPPVGTDSKLEFRGSVAVVQGPAIRKFVDSMLSGFVCCLPFAARLRNPGPSSSMTQNSQAARLASPAAVLRGVVPK